jgi:hypothetical protein
MKLSDAKIDPARLEEGAWVGNIPELTGLRLRVRGANNKDWRRIQSKLIEGVPRKKRVGGRMDPDEQDRITAILLRETCLLDWDGLEDDDGKPLPYSKEMAGKLLSDPQYAKFREGVMWAASIVAEQTEAEVEDDAKN